MVKIFKKSTNKIHIMNSLDGLGWSLIGIFIPIYLFNIGYEWEQIFVYFIIQNTAILISSIVIGYAGQVYSLKKILLFRFPILLIFLALLYFIESKNISIQLLAICDGIQIGLYQLPMHIIFSRFVDDKKVEKDTGNFFAIPQFIGMFGPLVGGFVFLKYGFSIIFVIAFSFFILAFVPVLLASIEKINYDFNFRAAVLYYRKYPKYFYAEIFSNIAEEIEGVIWPIFVYINVLNIASVGIVGTALAVSSAIFTLFVGKISRKENRSTLIFRGVVFMMVIWILRFFLEGEFVYYILTVLSGVAYVVFSVPYYARIYEMGKREETVVFFAFREVPVWISRMIVFALAIYFVDNLQYLFIVAAAVYIYFFFWNELKGEEIVSIEQ